MINIISYSLFEPNNSMVDRSFHDAASKERYRYWANIPFIYIVNNIFFNNYKNRLYVSKDIKNHPLYVLLENLSKLQNFELEFIDKEEKGTSPATWRVKSIWDYDSDICFCRDLDSVMSPKEAKSMIYFINSEYWINNIRGLCCHNDHGAMLMAGLSGFKSNILRTELNLSKSFDQYINFCESKYGTGWASDQYALIDFFIKSRNARVISKVLDFYIQPVFDKIQEAFSQEHVNNMKTKVANIMYSTITSLDESNLSNINLDFVCNDILSITGAATVWMGQPVDVRGKHLNSLLSLDNDMCKQIKDILLNNNILKEFYKI